MKQIERTLRRAFWISPVAFLVIFIVVVVDYQPAASAMHRSLHGPQSMLLSSGTDSRFAGFTARSKPGAILYLHFSNAPQNRQLRLPKGNNLAILGRPFLAPDPNPFDNQPRWYLVKTSFYGQALKGWMSDRDFTFTSNKLRPGVYGLRPSLADPAYPELDRENLSIMISGSGRHNLTAYIGYVDAGKFIALGSAAASWVDDENYLFCTILNIEIYVPDIRTAPAMTEIMRIKGVSVPLYPSLIFRGPSLPVSRTNRIRKVNEKQDYQNLPGHLTTTIFWPLDATLKQDSWGSDNLAHAKPFQKIYARFNHDASFLPTLRRYLGKNVSAYYWIGDYLNDSYYTNIGNYALSLRILEEGLRLCHSPPEKVRFYYVIGELLYDKGRFSEAAKYLVPGYLLATKYPGTVPALANPGKQAQIREFIRKHLPSKVGDNAGKQR